MEKEISISRGDTRKGWKKKNKKGYKMGLEEGRKEGLLLEAQAMVLEVLEEKFGTVEESLKQRIKELKNRALLKRSIG